MKFHFWLWNTCLPNGKQHSHFSLMMCFSSVMPASDSVILVRNPVPCSLLIVLLSKTDAKLESQPVGTSYDVHSSWLGSVWTKPASWRNFLCLLLVRVRSLLLLSGNPEDFTSLRHLLCSQIVASLREVSEFFPWIYTFSLLTSFSLQPVPLEVTVFLPWHSSVGAGIFRLGVSPSHLSGVCAAQCGLGPATFPVPQAGCKMLLLLDSTPCDSMWNPTLWVPIPPVMRNGVQCSYTAGNLLPS